MLQRQQRLTMANWYLGDLWWCHQKSGKCWRKYLDWPWKIGTQTQPPTKLKTPVRKLTEHHS